MVIDAIIFAGILAITLVAVAVTMLALDDAGCTCDPRFAPVASDVDCPLHGLAAVLCTCRKGAWSPSCPRHGRRVA